MCVVVDTSFGRTGLSFGILMSKVTGHSRLSFCVSFLFVLTLNGEVVGVVCLKSVRDLCVC